MPDIGGSAGRRSAGSPMTIAGASLIAGNIRPAKAMSRTEA